MKEFQTLKQLPFTVNNLIWLLRSNNIKSLENNGCNDLIYIFYNLVLGPFKLEVYLIKPYRVVFHDFLNEAEIEWMIEYSKPRLSHSRGISVSNFEGSKHEFREGKRTRTVHKTVQV